MAACRRRIICVKNRPLPSAYARDVCRKQRSPIMTLNTHPMNPAPGCDTSVISHHCQRYIRQQEAAEDH